MIKETPDRQIYTKPIVLKRNPVSFSVYSEAFAKVRSNIQMGNSYLLNLTFPTLIECALSLEEIYEAGVAK